jgi:SAM-dependent methyltransferase
MEVTIKTMELYNHIDRVQNELKELGLHGQLTVDQLSDIDSMHYLGNDAIRSAIERGTISEKDSVLDIGSGLGGPARLLSHLTNCNVDAIEIQGDLSDVAQELTFICSNKLSIRHICGDFLLYPLESCSYSRIVSWLVFLHIPDRVTLFKKCFEVLKPGGIMYVEDFYMKEPFTLEEKKMLSKDIFVSQLPTMSELKHQLQDFEIICMDDLTDQWKNYVHERYESYQASTERNKRVHGEKAVDGLLHFYGSIDSLFQGGHLGGVCYAAKKH